MCPARNLLRTAMSPIVAAILGDHDWCRSVPEQALEPRRCQFGVADGMLDRLVAQIALDGSGIDAIICQFEAAAMPQHVRMDFRYSAAKSKRCQSSEEWFGLRNSS